MILAALLLAFALTTPVGRAPIGSQGNRHWRGELEVRGPVESIRLDFGAHGTTRVERSLGRRESAIWSVPAPSIAPLGAADLERRSEPEISVVGEGSAVWLGWSESQPLPPPSGILARGRPPLARGIHPDRTGAGLVTVGIHRELFSTVSPAVPEAIFLDTGAWSRLITVENLSDYQAVLVGPGVGAEKI